MPPPTLPHSLSPHICILASPDVQDVFDGAGVPPLPEILQCFSPLPQITTRTTSLTSVPHPAFALRFSDVLEIENAVHEDEEQRASRTMDWIGSRISQRCERWVEMLETELKEGGKMWRSRTPWWEEVKECVDGDHVPSSVEGWNHPVSLILAVSTTAVNPLQALQDLASCAFDFPPWVDLTSLRYFPIIHPSNSPLAEPIAEALFNAVKKQYGLHSFLLPLQLPSPPPPPVPVPAVPPRLPTLSAHDSPSLTPQVSTTSSSIMPGLAPPRPPAASPMPRQPAPPPLTNKPSENLQPSPGYNGNTLTLTQDDIQQIGRFVREFVTMSLVPWMERCVVEWNENYSSSRRLPSRLFSSTRRLFGASSTSSSPATPTHGSSGSISSTNSRFTHGPNNSVSSITSVTSISTMGGGSVNQQRRLAGFATILGDYKLAMSVWETLRKEARGGSDVLLLLSAPSPALALHAEHALATPTGPQPRPFEAPALAQYGAFVYAAEEPPTATLYAHAAFLSELKGARRRAALWYLVAADKPDGTLSSLTVTVRETSSKDVDTTQDCVEVIEDVTLGPRDTRTIPIDVKCSRPASLVIAHATYEFFALLPCTESLAVRGRRLNDTPIQRQGKVYAPDILIKIEVEEAGQRLHAHFVDDRHLTLAQGKYKHQRVWLTNSETRSISELWLLTGEQDELWVDTDDGSAVIPSRPERHTKFPLGAYTRLQFSRQETKCSCLSSYMQRIMVNRIYVCSSSSESINPSSDNAPFHCTRVTRRYEVKPILKVTTSVRPSASPEQTYIVGVEVENTAASSNIQVTQVSTMSALWTCSPLGSHSVVSIPPRQAVEYSLGASPWRGGAGATETRAFVARKVQAVLKGDQVDASEPPPLDLICTHLAQGANIVLRRTPATRHFLHCGRRTMTAQATAAAHPDIPSHIQRAVFPLYNPSTVDIVVFWELPARKRAGHVLLQGPALGAQHAALKEIIEAAQTMKVKRSMYAETHREREAILESVKNCEWNQEGDPIAVFVKDGSVVEHDFRQGPCHVPIAFTLRNLSLTHPARSVLKLAGKQPGDGSIDLLPPPYAGRPLHRHTIAPSESVAVHAKLWATRPGCFALDSWTAETEVGEPAPTPASHSDSEPPPAGWKSRHLRYVQSPRAGERPCVAVVDTGRVE
ncbi:ER-golgi trafficking TRAPP I complex 85 kDa subunit-domain-containing protein [Earliella scabrosa]|nr:ER-golgi trafficking TRAPP I complex 85 kDa subunit-domain-containing protein [Earliella scabrosa]